MTASQEHSRLQTCSFRRVKATRPVPRRGVLCARSSSFFIASNFFSRSDCGAPRTGPTVDQLLRLNPLDEFEQACGALPVNGMIEVARRRSLRPSLLDLRNSGDTYAALTFAEQGEKS